MRNYSMCFGACLALSWFAGLEIKLELLYKTAPVNCCLEEKNLPFIKCFGQVAHRH